MTRQEITEELKRLLKSRNNDAVKLACLGAEDIRTVGRLDLKGVTEFKRSEKGCFEVDLGLEQLDTLNREMCLATAEGEGLDAVEALLPYHPASETARERREALAALLRIGGDSFTLSAVNDTISGCGIAARAAEGDRPGYVEITFPETSGIPASFDRLRAIIEDILPCHLEVTYLFWYNTWQQLEQLFGTWGGAADTGLSWYGLATKKL